MLIKVLSILIFVFSAPGSGQTLVQVDVVVAKVLNNDLWLTVRNVVLLQHKTYLLKVIEETVHGLEDYGLCNLKLPDITQDINVEVFGESTNGTVAFKNGFVISSQHVDTLDSSLQQVWLWNSTLETAIVSLRGKVRLHDVALGFDVEAVLNGDKRVYTAKIVHRMAHFDIDISTFMNTNETSISVTGVLPDSSPTKITYLPEDEYTPMLTFLHNSEKTAEAVKSWGDVLQPIVTDVVVKKVTFPTICYDCAA